MNQKAKNVSLEERSGSTFVCVYLILKQEDQLCLLLRRNTGYYDGYYGLIAGHVEDGESAIAGMIREAYEEAGLELNASQMKVVHVMHRQTNRLNIDVFFDCQSWESAIKNLELEKCRELDFFSLGALPSNVVDYNEIALKHILRREFYSELGWGG